MRKGLKLIPIFLASMLVLAGCSDFSMNWPMRDPEPTEMDIDTEWVDYSVPFTDISFGANQDHIDLHKGDTFDYTYTYAPKDANAATLVWKSSKPSVATIDRGHLVAIGGGQTTITLSANGVEARSIVTVTVPIVDFKITERNVSLGFDETYRIVTTLLPEDTTEGELTYKLIEGDNVAQVDETGLVTSFKVEGTAKVRVTSPKLNKFIDVVIKVSDAWNYVKSISLTCEDSEVEVGQSVMLTSEVKGVHENEPISTIEEGNFVKYSVAEGSEELASINEQNGVVYAHNPGEATFIASIYDSGNQKTHEASFTLNIFEVSATAISFKDQGPIELDNVSNPEHQLQYEYVVDRAGYTRPSRGNIKFSTSDANVARVSDEGLVSLFGLGSATIKVEDTVYKVSDEILVNTTVHAKSVALNASGELYLDETITVSATVSPAQNSDTLTWVYNEGKTPDNADEYATFEVTELGNSVQILATSVGRLTVKAKIGQIESTEKVFNVTERIVEFENGKTYIIGSKSYKNGVSKDVGPEGSWTQAKYAFEMKDKTGNLNAKYEYKATIEFAENDLWIIQQNEADRRPVEAYTAGGTPIGRYKIDEGAFAKGQMEVTSDSDKNIRVKQAGKYDIYFAFYETAIPEGWYEVYVEAHGLKVSSDYVKVKLNKSATITASNWEGTLLTVDSNDGIVTTSLDASSGLITITPTDLAQVGDITSFKVKDSVKEIEVTVEIKEGSTAEVTDYYIRGTAASGWGDVSDEYQLTVSSDPHNIGEIKDVHLVVGDFKIANADWSNQWGWEYDNRSTVIGGAASYFSAGSDNNNIHCSVEGDYDVYLTVDNYIAIELVGGTPPVIDLSSYYVRGDAVEGNWDALPQNQLVANGDDLGAIFGIELSVGDFKIANADWTKSWGWLYKNEGEENDHVTIAGAAAEHFEAASGEDNNIHVKDAGKYNLFLTKDNYIPAYSSPGRTMTRSRP